VSSRLEARDLRLSIPFPGGRALAVSGLSMSLAAGETLALVGESGCGKSLTALALLGLLPEGVRREGGEVLLDGKAVASSDRGRRIGLVFQDPQAALNPVRTVGGQVAEVLRMHRALPSCDVGRGVEAALARVGLPDPARQAVAYPHELSGGMRQRAAIAIALAGGPSVLLADEPTTALDATVQAQVLELLRRLSREEGLSVLLVTHDLGVASTADRIAVMYAGRVVEEGPARAVLASPGHPYTRGLMGSRPADPRAPLSPIPGQVPTPGDWPSGCAFHPRCGLAEERCRRETQELMAMGAGRLTACWKSAALLSSGA